MKKTLMFIAISFAIGQTTVAQVGDALTGTAPVSNAGATDETLFRTVVKELSDDKFGGRKPLSAQEAPTLDYIAAKFREVGMKPAVGGSYFQKVPMIGVKTNVKNGEVVFNGAKSTVKLRYWDDIVVWTQKKETSLKVSKSDLVFVGFGINAPEYGWNDYEGVDVKGKVAVIMVNDPGFYDDNLFRGKNMTYYGRWTYKFEEAGRQGAAAALIIHQTDAASYGWSVVQNSRASESLFLFSEKQKDLVSFQGWVTGESALKLFNAAGLSMDEYLAAAKKKGFKSRTMKVKASIESTNEVHVAESANVVGIIEGTDLKNEYIIYSAHWDHLGIGKAIDGDSIYNGADDNATGIAALVMLGDKFSKLARKPRRSIVFLAVTGEESGLLGSEYYSANPVFPLKKTVLCLNMDGYGDKMRTTDVTLSAAGHSELDRYVIDAAAAQGRSVVPSNNNSGGGYYRSDHFNFAKVGVPVVLAKGGRSYIDPEAAKAHRDKYYGGKSTYHQPSDEYHSWWNVSGSLEDIYLFYGIGLRLAGESYFPKWNDGVEYKAIREKQ